MSFSQCKLSNWPIINSGFCWFTMYVMWAIFRSFHYVDLWLAFPRSAYGISYTTLWKKCQSTKCIAPNATSRPRFPRLDSKINIKFSFMVIYIWLKIWRIVARWLIMGLIFALGLLFFSLQNQNIIHGGFPLGRSTLLFGLGDFSAK